MIPVGIRQNALGAGEPGAVAQRAVQEERTLVEETVSRPAGAGASKGTETTVIPPDRLTDTPTTEARKLPTELIVPQPPEDPQGDGSVRAAAPEPAGPLKTFAQIPTQVMQEISRLREEAAESNAQGVPGRNDPTPMPASPEAIGTGMMPYNAA